MLGKFKTLFLLLTALGLAACGRTISSDVTRFNDLTRPTGETFIIVAKEEAKEGSLELSAYSKIVSRELQAQGYVPATSGNPDLVVSIDFGISEPFEMHDNYRPAPYFGHTYFGRRLRHYDPFYDPFYPYYYGYPGLGGFYYDRYRYLYDTRDPYQLVYERSFEMVIEKNNGPPVFEGRALSVGPSNKLPEVMPLIIKALFIDFPGEDGSTVRIRVNEDK